jgi:hypothetical protein
MTYKGKPYYPAWLDNLADDVTGEGAAWDGAIQGAAAVHEVVVAAREIYEFQDFHYEVPAARTVSSRTTRLLSAAYRFTSSSW